LLLLICPMSTSVREPQDNNLSKLLYRWLGISYGNPVRGGCHGHIAMCPNDKNEEDNERGEHQHLAGLQSKVCQAVAAVSYKDRKFDIERMARAAR